MTPIPPTHPGLAARFASWARPHWRTTTLSVVSAVLPRLQDRPTWQDVAAALVVTMGGSLATSNLGKPAPGPGTS